MNKEDIREIQKKIGATPDGEWGIKSRLACEKHLRSLMPAKSPWPKNDDASMSSFYGKPGDESNLMRFDLPLGTLYEGKPARHARANERCWESLSNVLNAIALSPHKDVLKNYAGIYNLRKMRGGSRFSKHAWGAAIDLDPATNGNKMKWPQESTMPFGVMELFSKEGWVSAGGFWGRDAMHFEACQP